MIQTPSRQRAWLVGAVLVALLAGGCASEGSMRPQATTLPARDVPALFERGAAAPGTRAETSACWSPMVDPRDGTSLRLVRSANGLGDYEPPAGRYGVGSGQLLRLECASGKTVGIVAR